ncbi:MAG: beta-ketoacyl synthase N-terminal-like domain-containing protein, partial [Patescibacteria group bacterium]|nr:beta-ketoacyl synthase N-terminal-like domain-containing protein [Patescibacteria group bacterium]
ERRKDFSHILKNPHYTEFLAGGFVPEEDIGKDLYAKGAYLDEIDKFDADFFGIPPREARFMDPNQRFFLQTAWEAIEDAGYGGDKIVGTNTAILAGKENSNTLLYKYITEQDPMHMTGSWESIMTSRIAYLFDLKGPCMVVDTACSSGLIAIHMACQLLRLKHSDMAIAGGINLTYGAPAKVKGPLDLSSIESTDSTVRTFDKNANGTVWGEGVAIMLLKPLKKALADGDNIHAIIKGSAINNDGASNGITAPNAEAQEEVLVTTWKDAIINPETIGYIEAHGTGTVLGDPIEIKGLTNAFQRYTSKKQFCGIGSLKSNLGHLVATSGVVSLVKIVLSLKHKKIAPTINFSDPNPYINFCDSPFYVCNIPQNWESSQLPRRAGASSFGFSGTNCHMILEEYIEQRQFNEHEPAYKCLTLSAKSEEQIQELLERYDTFLNKQPHEESPADICYTSNIGRGHYSHRLLLLVKNREELKEKIHFLQGRNLTAHVHSNIFYGYHRIVSASKPDRGPGEVTTQDVRAQSDKAQEIIKKVKIAKDSNLETLLQKLASLYITGADINWDILYDGARRKRVSLPIYPFKRTRVWAGPRISQIKSEVQVKQISHPLLDRCVIKSLEQDIYQTYFTTEKHWVLTDHRIMGNCVIPGTTYIEMAIRVSRYYYPDTSLDLKDIIFLTPLQVEDDDEEKEVQTIIK